MAQSNLYVNDVSAEEARVLLDLALSIGVGARYARFDTPSDEPTDSREVRYQVVVDHADVRDFVRELCRRVIREEGAAFSRLERIAASAMFPPPPPVAEVSGSSAASRRRSGALTAAQEDGTDDA